MAPGQDAGLHVDDLLTSVISPYLERMTSLDSGTPQGQRSKTQDAVVDKLEAQKKFRVRSCLELEKNVGKMRQEAALYASSASPSEAASCTIQDLKIELEQ